VRSVFGFIAMLMAKVYRLEGPVSQLTAELPAVLVFMPGPSAKA